METKHNRATVILLTLILVVLVLSNISAIWKPIEKINDILTPIYIGFVLAFLLNPLVKIFERKVYFKINKPRLIRTLSVLSAYILVIGVLVGFSFIIVPDIIFSVQNLISNGPGYINSLINNINNIIGNIIGHNSTKLITLDTVLNKFIQLLSSFSSSIINGVLNVFTSVIDILKNILVGIFVSIYVLLSKERLAAGAKRVIMAVFKKDSAEQLLEYTHIANVKFGGYVMGNMLDCVMIGCISFVVFTIFGIPYASLISFIIGVTNFIPFFGPFIGGIPSAIIILIADPSKVILFLIIIVVMQQIDGNLIQPKIIGDKTGLSSLGVIFAITLMGGIFGFIGLVIGAPTIALLSVIINDKIEHRLSAKSLSRDIGDYYNDDDLIKPDDIPNEHLVNRIWDKIKTKISDRKNKNDKK
jgi:predicted PurR-regulated permease PerM